MIFPGQRKIRRFGIKYIVDVYTELLNVWVSSAYMFDWIARVCY